MNEGMLYRRSEETYQEILHQLAITGKYKPYTPSSDTKQQEAKSS